MNLSTQKRLAGSILKCSPQRVKFNPEGLDQIKEAITRSDIKNLINRNVIVKENIKGISRVRANKIKVQKSKGRRKGPGSQKGTTNATIPRKRLWINKIRLQRSFIRELNDKDLISQ
jgi:large subunit ribosomal protein L19e